VKIERKKDNKVFKELIGGEVMPSKLTNYLKTHVLNDKNSQGKLFNLKKIF
jgi:hypothetical protein